MNAQDLGAVRTFRQEFEIILRLVNEEGLTVLLSTAYLDEAERCKSVIVLHEGKVLADGAPSDMTAKAVGRTFRVDPPPGDTARALQARLLDQEGIVDAVPQGGSVRLVSAIEAAGAGPGGSGCGASGVGRH